LVKKSPGLKTNSDIWWNEKGAGENLKLLCELLKGNAIQAKALFVNGDESEEEK